MKLFIKSLTLVLFGFSSACSTLIGNIKPTEEKSQEYKISDISKNDSEWVKLENPDSAKESDSLSKSEAFDTAFQSKRTASIISTNSACKTKGNDAHESNLSKLSQQLLLGMTDIKSRTEEKKIIQGVPALETTVEGKLNKENVMVRILVLTKGSCVYDVMYIARPEEFKTNEKDFAQFVSGLKLR